MWILLIKDTKMVDFKMCSMALCRGTSIIAIFYNVFWYILQSASNSINMLLSNTKYGYS